MPEKLQTFNIWATCCKTSWTSYWQRQLQKAQVSAVTTPKTHHILQKNPLKQAEKLARNKITDRCCSLKQGQANVHNKTAKPSWGTKWRRDDRTCMKRNRVSALLPLNYIHPDETSSAKVRTDEWVTSVSRDMKNLVGVQSTVAIFFVSLLCVQNKVMPVCAQGFCPMGTSNILLKLYSTYRTMPSGQSHQKPANCKRKDLINHNFDASR